MSGADRAQLKALFAEAAELAPGARGAFLDRACTDPALRRELESLLDAHERASGFLQTPLARMTEADDLVGATIGPYRLVRHIGAGGMGTVYEAVRADAAYEKTVAIKIVKRGLDTDEVLQRFQRERQTLARLDHPNIARIFDGGATPDGRPYLVMDFVAGQHIDEYCNERRLPVAARLELFRTICGAVQHAHQHLVIHRDLKPDNMLVTADGVPVLVDFGVAKALEPADEDVPVTRLADRRMTLAYASPEQVRGEPTATVSDVYSLGVILFELLTGRAPYRRPITGVAAYEQAIAEGPRRPSESLSAPAVRGAADAPVEDVAAARSTTPAPLARQLSGDLDTIVLKAIQPEPGRRYASAQQLAEDLGRFLTGMPVIARPDTIRYRTRKFVRRHRASVAAGVLALLALAAGLAGTIWQARAARLERDHAQASARQAEQVTAFLSSTLSAAAPDEAGRDVTVVAAMDRAAARASAELANDPVTLSAIRTTIGQTYLKLGAIDKAVPQLEDALAVRRRTLPDDDPLLIDAFDQLASAYDEQGELALAEQHYREALDRVVRTAGPDSPRAAILWGNLGVVIQHSGRMAEAEPMLRRSVDLSRRLKGTPAGDAELAQRVNDLAVALGTQDRWDEALPLHREALELIERVRGPRHSEVAAALGSLATALTAVGRADEAEPYYLRSIALRTELAGADAATTAWARYQYASMLLEHGRPSEAMAQARQVVALRRTFPDAYPPVSASLLILGRASVALGHVAEAEPYLRDSLALRTKSMPPGHWLTATSQSFLGDCLARLGRFRDAEPLLLDGYRALNQAFGQGDRRTREAAARLASMYEASGRPALAEKYGSPPG